MNMHTLRVRPRKQKYTKRDCVISQTPLKSSIIGFSPRKVKREKTNGAYIHSHSFPVIKSPQCN